MTMTWGLPRYQAFTEDLLSIAEQMSSSAPSPPNSANERTSNTNLYIKGISEDFSNTKLRELVPDPAQIKSVKAATEESDAKCKGYGFIDFHTEEAAMEAMRFITKNHPTYTVKFAKENEKDKTNLYVTNIPKTWTTKDSDRLKELFEKFGPIQSAFIMVERNTNRVTATAPYHLRRSGVGFVRFANEQDAQKALDGLRNSPTILPGCTAPVEAKYADKHNPESRRRRQGVVVGSPTGAPQLNGMVRAAGAVGLGGAAALPALIQQPANAATLAAAYPHNIYSALYGLRATPSAASAANFPSYQLATGYHPSTAAGLGQSYMGAGGTGATGGLYQLSSPSQTPTSLALGHTNGISVDSQGLSGFPQLLLANGLTNPTAAALSSAYGHCIDYTNQGNAAYQYALATAQPADH